MHSSCLWIFISLDLRRLTLEGIEIERVMTMIPKELFLSTIEKILRQRERINAFEIALKELCDGHPVFDRENLYLEALLDLLKYSMKDTYDNIDWWLYEAPKDSKSVFWEEDGKVVSVDLAEPEALYDYLVGGVKARQAAKD